MQWLGEFQILACIPLQGRLPIKDLASLTSVSLDQLTRVIRLTASAGFLAEPQANHVEHTHLSAAFILNPSYLDAVMFMAEAAAPAALHMAEATHNKTPAFSHRSFASTSAAYISPDIAAKSFHKACGENPRLRRQLSAYLHHAGGLHDAADVVQILNQLNWSQIPGCNNGRGACLVEVG